MKNKRAETIKRPNAFLYFIVYILIYPLLKIAFRLKIEYKDFEMPDGAYIMLSNHNTMLDFIMIMLSFYPHKLNAVGAQKWFLYKPLNWFLPTMGVIPKNMFDPDLRSIMNIKTVLKRGDGILLFPEGRCSSSQVYTGMHKSTGKLIQKFNVPVISCYVEGAQICVPHWRKGFRFGNVRITYRNMFTADEAKTLSVDEINDAVDARLSGSEGALPVTKPFRTVWSKRLAEGLEKILFYCPKCSAEYMMETEGNLIRCTACGNEVTVDRESKLTPSPDSVAQPEISLWFRDQVRHEMSALHDDMEPFVENVKVQTPAPGSGEGTIESGSGIMRLDPKGWHFDGELFGESTSLFFPIDTLPAISYDHNKNFQIYYNGDYFMFAPEDTRMCFKYVILTECMHWKFASKVLMTPGKNSGYV